MCSDTTKILAEDITFVLQYCNLEDGAPSTRAGALSLAFSLDAGQVVPTLSKVELRLRQLS
jgi:hypothetical protein